MKNIKYFTKFVSSVSKQSDGCPLIRISDYFSNNDI